MLSAVWLKHFESCDYFTNNKCRNHGGVCFPYSTEKWFFICGELMKCWRKLGSLQLYLSFFSWNKHIAVGTMKTEMKWWSDESESLWGNWLINKTLWVGRLVEWTYINISESAAGIVNGLIELWLSSLEYCGLFQPTVSHSQAHHQHLSLTPHFTFHFSVTAEVTDSYFIGLCQK